MIIKKRILSFCFTFLGLLFSSTSFIACSKVAHDFKKEKPLIKGNFFLDPKIQNSLDKKHLIIENSLQRKDIKKIPKNLNSFFASKILVGGYGEERHFYKQISNKKTLHLGIDAIVKEKNPLFSPADGQMIASYWLNIEGAQEETFANGIGGVVIVKYKLKDLYLNKEDRKWVYVKSKNIVTKVPKIAFIFENKYYGLVPEKDKVSNPKEPFYEVAKQEYEAFLKDYKTKVSEKKYNEFIKNQEEIIVSFIHLSKETAYLFNKNPYKPQKKIVRNLTYNYIVDKNISYETPLEIKKGFKIGYVGGFAENGDWSPHVHVNTYFYLNNRRNFFYSRLPRYKWTKKEDDKKTLTQLFISRPLGVNGFISNQITTKNALLKAFASKGYFDPNNIFNLYDNKTEKAYLSFLN